jgi:hypothetical protein
MNGMDEQQRKINERMAVPMPLVSDDEVKAAKAILDRMSALAGREQPVPDILVRFMLEEAAKVRAGALSFTNGVR